MSHSSLNLHHILHEIFKLHFFHYLIQMRLIIWFLTFFYFVLFDLFIKSLCLFIIFVQKFIQAFFLFSLVSLLVGFIVIIKIYFIVVIIVIHFIFVRLFNSYFKKSFIIMFYFVFLKLKLKYLELINCIITMIYFIIKLIHYFQF